MKWCVMSVVFNEHGLLWTCSVTNRSIVLISFLLFTVQLVKVEQICTLFYSSTLFILEYAMWSTLQKWTVLKVVKNFQGRRKIFNDKKLCFKNQEREFIGTNIKQFHAKIKLRRWDTKKNLQNRLPRRAPLESFITFYCGLKLMAELVWIW